MNNLECSVYGDKRFSSLCAVVSIDGVRKTIDEWFYLSILYKKTVKKTILRPVSVKQSKFYSHSDWCEVDCIEFQKERLPKDYAYEWIVCLWYLYFQQNPDLLSYARQFDDVSNRFSYSDSVVARQISIIRLAVKNGLDCLYEICSNILCLVNHKYYYRNGYNHLDTIAFYPDGHFESGIKLNSLDEVHQSFSDCIIAFKICNPYDEDDISIVLATYNYTKDDTVKYVFKYSQDNNYHFGILDEKDINNYFVML